MSRVIVSVPYALRNVLHSSLLNSNSHRNTKSITLQAVKMTGTDNADVECIEEEDSWRTVNCLRGRLLAERMASKNASEEADQLGIRLLEVERLLEQEGKSRNRAEKKLKFLMKRLQSINISSATTEEAQKLEILRKEMAKSLDNDRSQLSSWSVSESTSSLMGSNENSKMESSSAGGHDVDNSMALVPAEMSSENERVDPEILDATVKQVLESLRRAKEQLRSSMDRRRMSIGMIKVG